MVFQPHNLWVFLQSLAPISGKWICKWFLGSNANFNSVWSALLGHVKRINFLWKPLNVTETEIQAESGNYSSFCVSISVSDKYKRGFN